MFNHSIDIYSSDSVKNKDGTTSNQRILVAKNIACSFQNKENKFLQNGKLTVVMNARVYIKEEEFSETKFMEYLNKRKTMYIINNGIEYKLLYLKTSMYNTSLDYYTLVVEEVIKNV